MSKEEIEKMTVAQIKEQLKNKKLPISGTKIELVNRLFEGIVAEEKLLEAPPSDFDISNIADADVDEVLGLDPSDILSSSNEKIDVSFGLIDNSVIEKGGINSADNHTILQNHNVAEQAKPNEPSKNKDKTNEMAQEKVIQLKMAARLGLPIADADIKTKRKQRFGTTSDEETLKRRADRFCYDAPKSVVDEESDKAKRALRFGLTSNDGDTKAKRAKRFDAQNSAQGIDQEKLLARAKRFGT